MQIINKKRGVGKTVGLIFASEATGYPIITFDGQRASNIIQMAAAMAARFRILWSLKENQEVISNMK